MTKYDWQFSVESWPFRTPYRFAGHVWTSLDLFVARVNDGTHEGIGEGAGVYYHDEPVADMPARAELLRDRLENGLTRDELQQCLPASGVRNAIDCALWDLESKRSGVAAWRSAGLSSLRPLTCVQTLSIADPDDMAAAALAVPSARALKLKLAGDGLDGARVRAVRSVRPAAWIGVDANQSLTLRTLEELFPALGEAKVDLLEQPLAVGQDAGLEGRDWPIPLAADESVQTATDIAALAGRYQVINIKLDKAGGLTEALRMADEARRLGMKIMVGNMLGTSRAMAPGMIVGQHCDVVDLDGPLLIGRDIAGGLDYSGGMVRAGACRWGQA
ncbi:Enolase superfamily enzyme related to L-alanine-DL-glutamate epimerase [uncultured Sphingopyxis sp.]|uniref:Dipeptide epimerase n=1 Tax=uncultured Sphingopyxis sp. TaxID=310581 RepID=A0A1Y5PUU9_9SPHN|nr:dipeptide epimerase [uncultured Sphingopyxis sp.]SBV32395.1 Enolase superfamily enzyme related to L-alanine-DL-glutamate epimerase [uncultured Sphingopyxis sp.]